MGSTTCRGRIGAARGSPNERLGTVPRGGGAGSLNETEASALRRLITEMYGE